MLLNADIVFDNLPKSLNAAISGPRTFNLALMRPELYEGGGKPFEANHLYLVHADRVPHRAEAELGSVVVSIGDSTRLERLRLRCTVITVSEQADFYQTFNALQGIYNSYDAWEQGMNDVIGEDGGINKLLDLSETIFGSPLFALDANFKLLGASHLASNLEAIPSSASDEGRLLSLSAFDQFLELHDLSMDEREPMALNLLDQSILSMNLFENDIYQGCLIVQYGARTYRPSDKLLIEFLGKRLLIAMHRLSEETPEGPGSLRKAVQSLVEERPLDAFGREVIDSANNGDRYVCMRMKLSNQLEQLPLGYVRNAIERAFPHSIVFEHHRNSVVAVIDIDAAHDDDYLAYVSKGIEAFTGSMEMKAGLSTPHNNLIDVRALFLQADAALDMGMLFAPNESLYAFEKYALRRMAIDAVGDMRLDLLLPEGLRKLVEHDRNSATSYVDTLRAYLDNNLSIAKTANQLFIHRSTMIERLNRIRRDLQVDLEDPDKQLYVRLLLKAMDTRNELRSKQAAK